MSIVSIDGAALRRMIISGANKLEENKALVDSLNVFPVPDGDTGTNMSLTILAAAREVEKLETSNISEVAKAAASGSLRGARGNSGVIVSQLFRGFSKGMNGKETADIDDFADAFLRASETARKAVMKPKEGTILTVAKVIAEKANEVVLDTDDLREGAKLVLEEGYIILDKTTNMLPQLKQAGVVDAGGKGLIIFLEGAVEGFNAEDEIEVSESGAGSTALAVDFGFIDTSDIKFAYCTEFFINVEKASEENEEQLKSFLVKIGDSIVLVGDDDIVKIHVHSNHPGKILEEALKYGYLSNLKIENMKLQHTSLLQQGESRNIQTQGPDNPVQENKKGIGFVAVAMGDGMRDLYLSLGVDQVIEGGQTMNPSTEDFLEAIGKINAEHIVLLPNNKNIILAAGQAEKLADKKTYVIPSKTMPQGLAAMIAYMDTTGIDENIEIMKDSLSNVKTGQITHAVRDTVLDGKEIAEGDILCMIESSIAIVSKELEAGAKELLDAMIDDDSEIVTIYYGADNTEDEAAILRDYVEETYSQCEVDLQNGGQHLYNYIFSVE